MITIVGTGHVFNISELMMFIVKQIWPEAVLVEMDEKRLTADQSELPWIYRNSAKYQKKIAKKNKTRVGNELETAVLTGKLVGAEIGYIDVDMVEFIKEMWAEMSFAEKTRYVLSTYWDRIAGKKGADRSAKNFSENQEKVMETMRRRYPTMMRKLVDERNEYMAKQIIPYADRYDKVLVVVGDMHVEGLAALLGDREIRKIRYGDFLDEKKLDKIRNQLWEE